MEDQSFSQQPDVLPTKGRHTLYVWSVIVASLLIIVAVSFVWFKNEGDNSFLLSKEGSEIVDSFDKGNLDNAINVGEDFVSKNKDDNNAKLILAISYAQKGSLSFEEEKYGEKALLLAEEIIKSEPDNSEAYRVKGYALEIMERYEEALLAYSDSISKDISNSVAFSNRGHAYQLMGENQKAKADYDQALKIDPELDLALLNRARLAYSENDPNMASILSKKTLEVSQNTRIRAEATVLLGLIETDKDNTIDAIKIFDQAVEIDSQFPQAYVGRAYAMLWNGSPQYENLIFDNVKKAIEINPNQTAAYLIWGVNARLIGDSKVAKEKLNQALAVVGKDITLSATEKASMIDTIDTEISSIVE